MSIRNHGITYFQRVLVIPKSFISSYNIGNVIQKIDKSVKAARYSKNVYKELPESIENLNQNNSLST